MTDSIYYLVTRETNGMIWQLGETPEQLVKKYPFLTHILGVLEFEQITFDTEGVHVIISNV